MSLIGPGEQDRVQFMCSIVSDRAELGGLRVLDLACRTGAFSTALANAGADVLGIEGRQENLDHVPPSSARFELADVRDISADTHGTFDVVLCLGILYHLEAADAVALLHTMREMTGGFAVIDTHLGVGGQSVTVGGVEYDGSEYGENAGHPWSSIGNPTSFWFTEPSLRDALRRTGWDTVTHVPGPSWPGESADRAWFVAE